MIVASEANNSTVYGAFNFGEATEQLTVDVVELITAELPVPSVGVGYTYNYAIAWALTLFVVDFDPSQVKAYNVPTGRFQFGETNFFAGNASVGYEFQYTSTQLYNYRRYWSYLRGIPSFNPDYVPEEISTNAGILTLQRYSDNNSGGLYDTPASTFIFSPQKSVEYVAQIGYIAYSASVLESAYDYILWLNN